MIRFLLMCAFGYAAFSSDSRLGILWAAFAIGLLADLLVNGKRRRN
jgi:hypothetical protein